MLIAPFPSEPDTFDWEDPEFLAGVEENIRILDAHYAPLFEACEMARSTPVSYFGPVAFPIFPPAWYGP